MDKKTVFIKTDKGEREADDLSSDLKRILMLIDNKSTSGELSKRAPPSLRSSWDDIVSELVAGGYVRDRDSNIVEPKITKPKFNPLKIFSPKPVEGNIHSVSPNLPEDDLDFSNLGVASMPNQAALAAQQKAEAEARERAAMEAAVAAAKARSSAEAIAKAEAKAKQEAEAAARAKAAAEAKAKQEMLLREQAETKAKQEAAARMKAQQEAARAKAEQEAASRAKIEAAARARAEIEKAARAQQEAEARAKKEAEARVRAEIEKAALARQEAEAKAKQEAEAARVKAEKEAARVKAELEAAERAKAEAEARVRAEIEAAARARQEAEAKAKREAEEARLKAEAEAVRVKAELEAAAKAKAEAEAARVRAEQEAARVKAELAAAKARAEAEAKLLADARAREIAEENAKREAEAQLKVEQAAAKREAEENARRVAELAELEAKAAEQYSNSSSTALPAFEINLEGFLGTPQPAKKSVTPASHQENLVRAEENTQVKQEAEQRVAAEAKPSSEKGSLQNVAAEMERLKEEADQARRKAEEEARRKADEQALAEDQAKAWAEAEHRAKAQAILEAEQAAQQAALSQAKAKRAPVARKIRKPLPLGKIAFGLFALVLLVVIVLPYVYPLDEYIAPLERRLSAQLKQPVHIGAMHAGSLPPRLQLQNVTIGNAQEVKVGNAVLNFEPLALFSAVKVIGDAELQQISIEGSSLVKQSGSLLMLGSDAIYPVRHLTLDHLTIVTHEVPLPNLNGVAELDAHGFFSRISLHSPDDKLGVDLDNDAGRWQLSLNLKESSLPVLPDLVFNEFSAKGVLSDSEVSFTEMNANIFDGILLGTAKLSWSRGWQLQGTLEAKTFDLDKMFPKLHVVGDTYGEGTFSMSGAQLSQLDDSPRLDGTFTVKKGTFNVDMVETARLLSRDNLVGGRTNFDEMSGQVQFENHNVHFRQLKITSEMLDSSGSFDVTSKDQLSGNFSAAIKMRPGSNLLTLYGTPAEPKLRAGH